MALTALCVLSVLLAAPTPSSSPSSAVLPVAAPQNPHASLVAHGRARSPAGGTPEPATMLLVAGAALGYGVLRRRSCKDAAKVTADA